MITSITIIQPPLTQLNCPYPSGAYLASFFRRLAAQGEGPGQVRWIDAGNLFFHRLFSRKTISRLFELSEPAARSLIASWQQEGREEEAWQLTRYLSLRGNWERWIDDIRAIVTGSSREAAHALVQSPHAVRGARMDRFLASRETELSVDDAPLLASLAIEDLADYITLVFDKQFSLVRYAEEIATSLRDFSAIEAALDGPMMRECMNELFCEIVSDLAETLPSGRALFCISVPFPGVLAGALSLAKALRAAFGERALISMGGGYVNTELRSCQNPALYRYIDTLSFDRGYGGYRDLLRKNRENARAPVPRRLDCPDALRAWEDEQTKTCFPDYAGIDFSRYPSLADSKNPMHRLWSDGGWLKAYLAHGCYWHRCSFCDVTLDYIKSYLPVDVPGLYAALSAQRGPASSGIHLVDEAAPPRLLRDFARQNRLATADGTSVMPFWGNIRFEKSFTRDLAEYLAAGGLLAVSGGIEIACPSGFKAVDKGIDLENLVATCAAFKESGVLVHAYLMYGYWNESDADLIDSMEVMRQLFAAGLVDSAFWHKFVLTRHSRAYTEWKQGSGDRSLVPCDDKASDFADNDLDFTGSGESSRYTPYLDAALAAWMAGEDLDRRVSSWFPFRLPQPRIAGNVIEEYIRGYERRRDEAWRESADSRSQYEWTASDPVSFLGEDGSARLVWWHLGEEIEIDLDKKTSEKVVELLERAQAGNALWGGEFEGLDRRLFSLLRSAGLVRISPL